MTRFKDSHAVYFDLILIPNFYKISRLACFEVKIKIKDKNLII